MHCHDRFLKEAAAAAMPARFVDQCKVLEVIHSHGVAKGVRAAVVGAGGRTFELRVLSPTVICAGGAINSPALLLRSKVPDASGMIGRNARQLITTPLHRYCSLLTAAARSPAAGTCGFTQSAQRWGSCPRATTLPSGTAHP